MADTSAYWTPARRAERQKYLKGKEYKSGFRGSAEPRPAKGWAKQAAGDEPAGSKVGRPRRRAKRKATKVAKSTG